MFDGFLPCSLMSPFRKTDISGFLATLPAQPLSPHFLASTPEVVHSVSLELSKKRWNLAQFLDSAIRAPPRYHGWNRSRNSGTQVCLAFYFAPFLVCTLPCSSWATRIFTRSLILDPRPTAVISLLAQRLFFYGYLSCSLLSPFSKV